VTQLKVRKWSAGIDPIPEVVVVWIRDLSSGMAAVYARCLPPAVPRQAHRKRAAG
jgi:hypothetical protein